MSRFLEGVFVLGCSLVGLGMGAPEGTGIRNSMNFSIHLIAAAQDNITANVNHFRANLCAVPIQMLRGLRRE